MDKDQVEIEPIEDVMDRIDRMAGDADPWWR